MFDTKVVRNLLILNSMTFDFALEDLRRISDLTPQACLGILSEAHRCRELRLAGKRLPQRLLSRNVAMIFEKPSLRTKIAFEIATSSLGGNATFLSSPEILASGNDERGRESVPDIARNLERFVDYIVVRTFSHLTVERIAAAVRIPVINALCDRHHPTQALADLMTLQWHRGGLSGLSVAFVGDGNNVATSLGQACALMGVNFRIASPQGYSVPSEEIKLMQRFAAASGSQLNFTSDPFSAVAGSDVVYTDTFISMGQEKDKTSRLTAFKGYSVNAELMSAAKPDALFMHCLPAHRGEEVSDEVFDGVQSVVFDQAECRLYVAQALLSVLGGSL